MIRINLLPYRAEQKKESARNQIIIFVVYIAVLVGILFWISSYLNGRIEDLKAKIEYTNREIAKYQKIANKVEEIKRQLAILQNKLNVIKNLEKRRKEALTIFDTMTNMVVENRMWLNSLKAVERIRSVRHGTGKKAKMVKVVEINITITGTALDNKTIADFMTNLQSKMDSDSVFKLTDQSFAELKDEGVPEDISAKLQSLKGKEHANEKEFADVLNETIGEPQTVMYKSQILKHAGKYFFKGVKLMYSRERLFKGNIKLKDFQIMCKNLPLEKS